MPLESAHLELRKILCALSFSLSSKRGKEKALNRLVCMQASEEASGKREIGFSKEQLQKKERADDDDDDDEG